MLPEFEEHVGYVVRTKETIKNHAKRTLQAQQSTTSLKQVGKAKVYIPWSLALVTKKFPFPFKKEKPKNRDRGRSVAAKVRSELSLIGQQVNLLRVDQPNLLGRVDCRLRMSIHLLVLENLSGVVLLAVVLVLGV